MKLNLNSLLKNFYFWAISLLLAIFTFRTIYLLVPNSVNNSNFLPLIYFAKNKAGFQNDMMYQASRYLFSFYYLIPNFLAPYLPANFIIYSTLIMQNILIFTALYYLSYELFPNHLNALVSIILIVFWSVVRYSLGTDAAFGDNLFPDLFAVPLLLFTFCLFFQERHLLAGFLTGIIFNFHGSHAVFVMFMFMTYYLFNFKKVGWKTIIQASALFIIGALPLVLVMILTPTPSGGEMSLKEWLYHNYVRRGHHCFPLAFHFSRWIKYFIIMALSAVAYFFAPSEFRSKQEKINYLALGVLFLCIIGTVFTDLFPIKAVINLTLFRSSRFLIILGMIFVSGYFLKIFRQENQTAALAVFLIFYALASPALYLLLLPITLFFLFLELKWLKSKMQYWLSLFLLIGFIEAVFFYLKSKYPALEIIQKIMPLDLMIMGGITFLFILSDFNNMLMNVFKQIKWTVLILFILSVIIVQSYPQPMKEYDQMWLDVQKWVSQNTPPDKLIITPPFLRGFRSFSERGIILSWFDSDDMSYVPHLGTEIMERLSDMGFSYQYSKSKRWYNWKIILEDILKNRYYSFNENYFRYLAYKYNCSCLVTVKDRKLNFPLLYQNKIFAVFKIQ